MCLGERIGGTSFFSVVILALMKVSDLARSTISMNERIDKQTSDATKKKKEKKRGERCTVGQTRKYTSDTFDVSSIDTDAKPIASKLHTRKGNDRRGKGTEQGDTETHSTLRHYATEKKKARAGRWICRVISRVPGRGRAHRPPPTPPWLHKENTLV